MSQPSHTQHVHPTDSISRELASAIFGVGDQNDDFDHLALRIFDYQFQYNTPYRNYCLSLGQSPENTQSWQEIPAIPTDAFKIHQHPLTTVSAETIEHTFFTSGTTSEVKGAHHFPSLTLYEQSITEAWRHAKLPTPKQTIFLTPSPTNAPHSSLSHMMGIIEREFSNKSSNKSKWAIHADGQLMVDTVESAAQSNQPISLLGTALAFLHLFEQLPTTLSLPKGSWAMETGGYKGTHRQLEKSELYQMFQTKLGLAPDSVINEYSMTELSSQFYTHGLGQPHHGPPWTRIRVIDPATEKDSAPGQPGHIIIYDLANLHSVMAIRTQDIAIAHGPNSFTLTGRDPSALPRGCSRAADHTLLSS